MLLLEAPARGLEEPLQILERQRQQRAQVPERAVRPLDAHERGERVRVVDRKRRRVVQRVVEPGRVGSDRARPARRAEKDMRADVGLRIGLERGRGVREADGRRIGRPASRTARAPGAPPAPESAAVFATSNTSNVARAHTPLVCVPRPSGRCCCRANRVWTARMPATMSAMSCCSVGSLRSKSIQSLSNLGQQCPCSDEIRGGPALR